MGKDGRDKLRRYLRQLMKGYNIDSVFAEEQVKAVMKLAKEAYETPDDDIEIPQEYIDAVYDSYPKKCVVSGRNLGKSVADKNKIKRLLGKTDVDVLVKTIKRYVDDCTRDKERMKNLSTFLNNLPEYDLTEKPKTVEIGGYRDLRKITEAQ